VPLESPTGGSSWIVRNVYEHQVMHIGIRRLDELLPDDNLLEFPVGRGSLLKPSLFKAVLSKQRDLRSLPDSDIIAAQRDVYRLSLVQAVRLRVMLLGNSTIAPGSTCLAAFIDALDNSIFIKLGERLCGSDTGITKEDMPKLAREALLMIAVSSVFDSCWWCWWPPLSSGEQRMFLNTQSLTLTSAFPAGGVLELKNYSKPDFNDASGKSKWLDWQIKRQASVTDLSTEPPRRASGIRLSQADLAKSLANLRKSR